MKLLYSLSFSIIFLCALNLNAQTITIEEARSMNLGESVTISGIITNGDELGAIRYIQDPTAGIGIYDGTFNFVQDVNVGDSVVVTGVLKDFRGLLELDPVTDYSIISSDNDLPDPQLVEPNDINEALEGSLVRIEGVSFDDGGTTISSSTVYSFQASGQEFRIFVRSNHPLIGSVLPIFNVTLIGIVSEFEGSYQLLLRGEEDIIAESNFFIDLLPVQTEITTSSFKLSWTTNQMGNSVIEYGTDETLGMMMESSSPTTSHEMVLDNLDPASFYYVKVSSSNGSETSEAPIAIYSTASTSSGDIKVYFNHSVDPSFSNGANPDGTSGSELNEAFMALIENAQSTIDIAAYNNNRTEITRALNDAHNRGVRVRYIHDNETLNAALQSGIDFATLNDNSSVDDGLMHHKFMVVDVDNADNCVVWTGSTNFTDENIGRDFNNAVAIQDQAVAKAYHIEFEEMWGSDGDQPGFFATRFATMKEDNTPHQFSVDGKIMEVYFSPSDNSSTAIEKSVRTADNQLMLALLTFTYNSLGTAVVDEHFEGTEVRVLLENGTDQGSEYDYIQSRGIDIFIEDSGKQLHHKYGIVDPNSSDPQVITGSHNWTNSAESRNDENVVIIHDADIANIFQQEFEKRWAEIVTSLPYTLNFEGIKIDLGPIPTSDILLVEISAQMEYSLTLECYDAMGKKMYSSINTNQAVESIPVQGWSAGTYYLIINDGKRSTYRKFVKQ